MTTKRSYQCNLCHSTIAGTDEQKARGYLEGQGVVFGGSHVPDQPVFKFTRVEDAENHICYPCIESVKRLG